MDEIICPFCDLEHIWQGDAMTQGTWYDAECLYCGKEFEVQVETVEYFTTRKMVEDNG